jgi:hypothetical protein
MDQTAVIAISLLALGLSALVVIRINRRDNTGDELTDCDSRTASLLNHTINEGK